MHVFVTGASGHGASYIIPELTSAGHNITGLARSEKSAAVVAVLGANVLHDDLTELDLLKAATAEADGITHLGYRADLIGSGGLAALRDFELAIAKALGDALPLTNRPLVVAGTIGTPSNLGRRDRLGAPIGLGRPATENDPALPNGPLDEGTLVSRNMVETTVLGLADQAVQSSVLRISLIVHSPTDRSGSVAGLAKLAKRKGVAAYPSTGENRWPAIDAQDLASLFRLALEKGDAGMVWHAVGDAGTPFREIAETVAKHIGQPVRSNTADGMMLPGYFGGMSAVVAGDFAASNAIARQALGWPPVHPGPIDDIDNGGNYFPTV